MKSPIKGIRLACAAVIATSLLATTTSSVEAFGPRIRYRRSTYEHVGWQHAPRQAPSYQETYNYMNYHYPKYYGGFHASYFQNMGIPPGDIGLRGNGIFMTPW